MGQPAGTFAHDHRLSRPGDLIPSGIAQDDGQFRQGLAAAKLSHRCQGAHQLPDAAAAGGLSLDDADARIARPQDVMGGLKVFSERFKRFANNSNLVQVSLLSLSGGEILQMHHLSRAEPHQVSSERIHGTGLSARQYQSEFDSILRVRPQSLHSGQGIDHHVARLDH